MDEWTLSGGTTVEFRRPADPQLPETARVALASAVDGVEGIMEAHLPVMVSMGVSSGPARQVLVLVIDGPHKVEEVMQSVGPKLVGIVPAGLYFDVMPLPEGHKYLAAVRKSESQIFGARGKTKAWWRVWS